MLLCLSIDHRHADLAVLERLQVHATELGLSLSDPQLTEGSVVLATCNRFEAYLHPIAPMIDSTAGSAPPARLALERVAAVTGITTAELIRMTAVHHGSEAAEHLFAVSAGLESAAIGEAEIAGQVRRALETARATGTVSSELERLFQTASRTSREVKHGTGIQSAGRSLVRLALRMAESRIGDWSRTRVLLVGTGAYSGASLAALRARGAQRIAVYSPSGRAQAFASSHAITPVAAGVLDETLSDTDLVIACSHTRDPLLSRDQFERTVRKSRPPFCAVPAIADFRNRFPRPRLLIDMGLPRNIDPDAATVPGIELLDLETVIKHAPIPELGAETEARRIVQNAAAEFVGVGAENNAAPAVVALRDRVNGVLYEELARLSRGGRVDPAIEAALRHFTGRLLHGPTVRLRELARDGRAQEAARTVDALFGSAEEPGSAPGTRRTGPSSAEARCPQAPTNSAHAAPEQEAPAAPPAKTGPGPEQQQVA